MVDVRQFAAVLSEFAHTLVTDVPLQGLLDRLVARVSELLPVSSAGVTLISSRARPVYVAASSEQAMRYEQLQAELSEGPCLAAFESGLAIAIDDLQTDERFPSFAQRAREAGLKAVFTFPLRQDGLRLGALNLYREVPGELSVEDLEAAQTLADVATAHLANAQAKADAHAISDRFRHNAMHDSLTGLPNRSLLAQRLTHASQRGRRSHRDAAVIFVDLDRFKTVNDSFGHRVGDELLVAVARRLTGLIRPGDTLARVSGDEFVILCEDVNGGSYIEGLARRIDQAFTVAFTLSDVVLNATASVGIAFAGPGQDLVAELVDSADAAMYEAKRRGGAGHHVVDMREERRMDEWVELSRDLPGALIGDGLRLWYQPIVRSADGSVAAFEGLLRWRHHRHGMVDPTKVVALAERSNLASELGTWVLRRACLDQRIWQSSQPGLPPLHLTLNMSAHQLLSPTFVSSVNETLSTFGTDPTTLTIELTESTFISDDPRTTSTLERLRGLGLSFAIDDFGTGYSALSYLTQFPVESLKIDKAFMNGLGANPRAGVLFNGVVTLAQDLGITVIAEGIETSDQAAQVLAAGCVYAQGFYYSAAVPADQVLYMTPATIDSSELLPYSRL